MSANRNTGDVQGILLAAGSATRFGSDKLMHPLADGTPIAIRSARNLMAALPGSIAVVRSGDSALARRLREEGLAVIECPEAAEGMGRTLAAGVKASENAAGWVVALADMPFLQPATIAQVTERLRQGDSIVAPSYRGERGHPVGFSAQWCVALASSSGDEGARALLKKQRERIALLETEDPGVVRDIDTRADLNTVDPANPPQPPNKKKP